MARRPVNFAGLAAAIAFGEVKTWRGEINSKDGISKVSLVTFLWQHPCKYSQITDEGLDTSRVSSDLSPV